MDFHDLDWTALGRLREAYLSGDAGGRDYWRGASDLASYDATFAQRIGWKWDYALAALRQRGWSPPRVALLDWGCGSGIATRAFLDEFGADAVSRVHVWDRSPLATRFAAARARQKYPGIDVQTTMPERPELVLLSHVLTELDASQVAALVEWLRGAQCVLWVEPGTHVASHALIGARERLRDCFNVVAPCLHNTACGLLAAGNGPHWCHHFATPPAGIFTDPFWGRFAQVAGVDLRSLPLSYLVLDKRPVVPPPAGAVRILGRPRVYKAHAVLLGCEASGVAEAELLKRSAPELFRRLRKDDCPSLQVWEREDGRIVNASLPVAGQSAPG